MSVFENYKSFPFYYAEQVNALFIYPYLTTAVSQACLSLIEMTLQIFLFLIKKQISPKNYPTRF